MGAEKANNAVEQVVDNLSDNTKDTLVNLEKNFSLGKMFEKFMSSLGEAFKNLFHDWFGTKEESKEQRRNFNRDISLEALVPLDTNKLEQLGRSGVEGVKKMLKAVADQFSIPSDIFQNLIKRESGFDIDIQNPSSSAYGLGQQTDANWATYGKGLDRKNPLHQAVASARYLEAIVKKNKCSWEEATAFYNTGENFDKDSSALVKQSYVEGNLKAIVWQIPWAKGKTAAELEGKITKAEYFKGATAYYSGKDYSEIS